ncbi:MAG: hypothetical protein ABIT01_00535, partial [Thermoanaerobaculia bacterium]
MSKIKWHRTIRPLVLAILVTGAPIGATRDLLAQEAAVATPAATAAPKAACSTPEHRQFDFW